MKKYTGEEFLNKIYKDLVNSEIVKHTGKGENKNEDVHTYMERLERITNKSIEHDKLSLLKKFYYDKYIIKPENVPESYFKQQEQIALDRGYGHVHYTDEIKQREIEQIISEQKASLDLWIDYFASKDAEMYPTWFKYYCFQGMVRLGYFDKKEDKYTKRTESTVKPFIEINREALAMVYDELIKELNKENIDDKKLEVLLKNGSFSKIYAYCIKILDSIKKDNTNSDEGIWKRYLQGSDPNILFNDIHGKGTGWCTAGGLETATTHLGGGDFYVFFTKDNNGEYTCPRIAIRMEYKNIAEIRGIAENQNLEPNMEKVVDKKLDEFPDKEEYKKKVKDMEMLTYIYSKWKNNNDIELNRDELCFLYETEEDILGFGYDDDPRIYEIKKDRNIKKDLSYAFNCKEEQISLTMEEALSENIICHYGNFDLSRLISAEGLILPEIIIGDLDLSGLTSAADLKLPKSVKGDLDLSSLTSAEGLILPETMIGELDLGGLTSAEGLKIPKNVKGDLNLGGLTSAEGLILPETMIGDLDLSSLTSAEGLILPEILTGFIYLNKLENANGLQLPKTLNGNLNLVRLTSTEGLILPEIINGSLYLNGLECAKELVFPKNINGSLDLSGLTSTEGLVLPETINGSLYLKRLECAKELVFPKSINGSLDLSGLTSAEGLVLPETINGSLYLKRLLCAEGLVFPKIINGNLDLNSLESAEGLVFPKIINGSLRLESLETLIDIVLPETINGDLSFYYLKSVEGLDLPKTIKGYLYLEHLTSFENLKIPKELNCKLICSLVNNDLNLLKQMCKENNKTK